MTTLQKTVITATLAIVAGVGIYEARQNSQLREQNQTLQQQQAPLADQIQTLQRSYDDATNQLAVLREDNERLNRSTAELLKLRAEIARLAEKKMVEQSSADANDSSGSAMKSWLSRVHSLKQRLEQTPNWKIPELAFLSEMDWLDAARNELGNDYDYRAAFGHLRNCGKRNFAIQTTRALDGYAKANNGQFPNDSTQLKPFFKPPVDEAILQRYKVVPTDNLITSLVGKFVLAEKSPVDFDHDTRMIIGQSGSESPNFGPVNYDLLRPVRQAYLEANPGLDEQPFDPSLLLPYATTRIEQSAINLLTKAIESYKRDHNGQSPEEVSDISPYLATP